MILVNLLFYKVQEAINDYDIFIKLDPQDKGA
jgi:hypothetical protein